jgi:hypothetical protein
MSIFSVDGTLIEAWASQKSFRPKDGSGDDDGGAKAGCTGMPPAPRHPWRFVAPVKLAAGIS